MQHTVFVKITLSKSGYVDVKQTEEKPEARYIGRLATRAHVAQVYTDTDYMPSEEMALLGRVARWLAREGLIDDNRR